MIYVCTLQKLSVINFKNAEHFKSINNTDRFALFVLNKKSFHYFSHSDKELFNSQLNANISFAIIIIIEGEPLNKGNLLMILWQQKNQNKRNIISINMILYYFMKMTRNKVEEFFSLSMFCVKFQWQFEEGRKEDALNGQCI